MESVIGAFRNASRAHRAIAISRESLARAKKQLEVNRSLIRGGRMAAREIIQTEAEVANRELALIESENRVSVANAALISILDVDEATQVRPVEQELSVEPLRPDVERSIETALRNRSDHLGTLMDIEVARLDLRKAKNERLWDLSLDASVARGGEQGRDYAVGVGLSIPLGDRSSKLAELSARNGLRDAEIGLVELRQSIRIEVRQAVHEVAVGFRRIELARILDTTLQSWGIEAEGEASEPRQAQGERGPRVIAASDDEKDETSYEPSRRVLDMVNGVLASVPGESRQRKLEGAGKAVTRSLLLSLREFEHRQTIAQSKAQSATHTAGGARGQIGQRTPHNGGGSIASSSFGEVLGMMALRSRDIDAAVVEQ